MKLTLFCALSFVAFAIATLTALAIYPCRPTFQNVTLWDSGCAADLEITKSEQNSITFGDGAQDGANVTGYGGCDGQLHQCYPAFLTASTLNTQTL